MAPLLLPNSCLEIGAKVVSNFEHEMFASLKATLQLTLNFPVVESPLWNQLAGSFWISTIANKHIFHTFGINFWSHFVKYESVSFATKNPQMICCGYLPAPCFFWRHPFNYVTRASSSQVCRCIDGLCPILQADVLVMKHRPSYFYNNSIEAFSYAIMLWCVRGWLLMLDPMCLYIFLKFTWHILPSITTS